jgi:hypothetical protein
MVQAVLLGPESKCRVPHIPDFLLSFAGSMHLMRLSLKKGAWSFYIFLSGSRLNQLGRAEFEGKGIE